MLLANLGIVFVGGNDGLDLTALRQALREVESDFAYIHVDGALDFGFSSDTVCLGPPSIAMKAGLSGCLRRHFKSPQGLWNHGLGRSHLVLFKSAKIIVLSRECRVPHSL